MLLVATDALIDEVRVQLDRQSFHEALRAIWQVVSDANRYVDAMAPWGLKKTNPDRMAEVLAVLVETIRQVAILVQPVMPESAARILDQLGISPDARDFSAIGGHDRLPDGHVINKPEPVFPRYVEDDTGQGG